MYGFVITKGCAYQGSRLSEAYELSFGDTHFYYHQLPKFEKDHLFFQNDSLIVLLDGVVFNKAELLAQAGSDDWAAVFLGLYAEEGERVASRLRGSFCGVIFEKASGRLLAFTNQSGERPVYYGSFVGMFCLASHVTILTELMAAQGIPVKPDIQSCRQLMGLGSILHGGTPVQGLRRLTAGKLLLWADGQGEEQRYHMFHNVPEHDMSLDECVDELDRRFRQAIDRIYGKNREYGYQAECDLSGGLDSRLATWVAHDLGYRDILNVCYCQTGKIDHKTSRKIAADLGNEYYFLPLDGGEFIKDIDETTEKFGGQVTFVICTGANRAMREVARHNIGLCVTGLLGELHNAYGVQGEAHTPPDFTSNRYSAAVPVVIPDAYKGDYESFEQMNFYEHYALLMLSSALVRQQQCEVTSPYVDVDFLEFSYRVPLKWRRHFQLTMTWMVKKYPKCADYVWQTKRMPVSSYFYGQTYLPKIGDDVVRFAKRVCNKIFRTLRVQTLLSFSDDMNPFEVWYATNPDLRRFIDAYFRENLSLVHDEALRADIEKTFSSDGITDKLQALSLLSVWKLYFSEA